MAFDEATLKAIAQLTEAEYFHAASADELKKVYQALSGKFVLAKEEREVTAIATALAALLALVAGALSLVWFNRL
jgi:Ca-activated chloride channel family protein